MKKRSERRRTRPSKQARAQAEADLGREGLLPEGEHVTVVPVGLTPVRDEITQGRQEQSPGDPELRAGDVDADKNDATFVGEEAPGMGNPTPDQDIVDDIGRASGLVYDDSEPINPEAKITGRDAHRWELDPASDEDYPERKRELDSGEVEKEPPHHSPAGKPGVTRSKS